MQSKNTRGRVVNHMAMALEAIRLSAVLADGQKMHLEVKKETTGRGC